MDVQLQDCVIRRLEIIGEAANRVSAETKQKHPDLPWTEMIGMRNMMIHEYDNLDFEIVWETVQRDLPVLIKKLQVICDTWQPN